MAYLWTQRQLHIILACKSIPHRPSPHDPDRSDPNVRLIFKPTGSNRGHPSFIETGTFR